MILERNMQAGISSFAFGWAVGAPSGFTADALLDFAVAQSVPVIQFGDNLPLHTWENESLAGFAERARTRGIAIETGARGLTPEHLARYIDVSRRVDARLLRFVIDATGFEPEVDAIIAIVREALPALQSANLVLGIENHDRFPCATLRRIIDAVASEQVGICLDTANSLGAGEGIGEVLAELAPVCVNLHLKDFAIQRLPYLMGFTVSGRPLGSGMLPIARVLRAVAKEGRCTTAVVELWTPPEDSLADTIAKEARWARQSAEVLRQMLGSLLK